ncbi:reticulon-like protein B9 [Dendrobium catenatum]|uniref:reticulon-like protein B9 n=1 Tax=Dendrobium catenatum TaxID=906689 RepID=UPI0010A059F2|nr:reticulon-like protein B9 [Dendrobium catenatum]
MLQSPFGVRRDIDDSRCPVRVRTVKSPFGVHGQGIAGIAASRTRPLLDTVERATEEASKSKVRSPPKLTEIILPENDFREFAEVLHAKLSSFLSILQDVTMGKNLRLFFMFALKSSAILLSFIQAIASLWIISILGSSCSSLNLLYFGYLCIQILPVLYENYEGEVDHLVTEGSRSLRKLYRKFDSKVLNKIPRGPVKDQKHI